jgi:hypothetical protein
MLIINYLKSQGNEIWYDLCDRGGVRTQIP